MELMNIFPGLFPLNSELTEFHGFISISGQDIRVKISAKEDNFQIDVKWGVARMFNTEESILIPKVSGASTISSVINVLHNIKTVWESELYKCNSTVPTKTFLPSTYFFKLLLAQMEELGWENVQKLDEPCQNITLASLDTERRNHNIEVSLTDLINNHKLKVVADLPWQFRTSTNEASLTLAIIFREFKQQLERLQPFWNCMDHMDQNYRILEPNKPVRKDTKRRIAITKNVSLLLTVDPLTPLAIPEFEFVGPEDDVTELQRSFMLNTYKWNKDSFVMENFKNVLKVEFLGQKSAEEIENESLPCGICYSAELNGVLPEKSCVNTLCTQKFHLECIYEWLCSLETTHHSCGVLFGECPYCQKKISCPWIK